MDTENNKNITLNRHDYTSTDHTHMNILHQLTQLFNAFIYCARNFKATIHRKKRKPKPKIRQTNDIHIQVSCVITITNNNNNS